MDGGSSMATLLSTATSVLTWLISGMSSFAAWITDEPMVLVALCIALAGACIGFFMRIFHSF